MICPYCRSKNVTPIIYGFPGSDMFMAAEKGEIKLGGCVISLDAVDNDAYCKDCKKEWSADTLQVDDIIK